MCRVRTYGLQALTSLGCMEHRGACSADADSGDGAGIMTQVPWKLLKEDLPDLDEQTTGCAAYLTAWHSRCLYCVHTVMFMLSWLTVSCSVQSWDNGAH